MDTNQNEQELIKRAKERVGQRIGLMIHVICWLVISAVITIVVPEQAMRMRVGILVFAFWAKSFDGKSRTSRKSFHTANPGLCHFDSAETERHWKEPLLCTVHAGSHGAWHDITALAMRAKIGKSCGRGLYRLSISGNEAPHSSGFSEECHGGISLYLSDLYGDQVGTTLRHRRCQCGTVFHQSSDWWADYPGNLQAQG